MLLDCWILFLLTENIVYVFLHIHTAVNNYIYTTYQVFVRDKSARLCRKVVIDTREKGLPLGCDGLYVIPVSFPVCLGKHIFMFLSV